MAEPTLFKARFDTTDDPDLDAETTLLEDAPLTLDEIKATCRRYRVRARYRDENDVVHELNADGEGVEPSVRRT
jgi:hypothetical protein